MSRSSIVAIVAIVVLGIVAVSARFFFRSAPATVVPSPPEEQPPAEVARAVPSRLPNARASPTPLSPEQERKEALAAMGRAEKERDIAEDLRHAARFPPTSQRIEDHIDPIVKTRAVKERLSPPGQGRTPTLVVFASALSYEAPNPIILFARFVRDYPGDMSLRTDAEVAGELRNPANQVVAEVDLRDDGQERDIQAGDGIFTARLTPEDFDQWNGLIRVQIYGQTADGDHRSARTRFYYGVPSAKLTGHYRDQLAAGHLEILAEVDVKAAAEYRVEGTLSGPQGLIAWAENTVRLDAGIKWMPLTFWGLALREASQPGPYQLSSIALANVSSEPPQLNDAFNPGYQTGPYKPQDFSDQRFDDPELMEKAQEHEERARRELQGR